MKKLFAIVLTVCMMISVAAFAAEEAEPFTVAEGITFGMSQDDLIAVLGAAVHEIDVDHTHTDLTFTEVEVKSVIVNGLPADVNYLLYDGKLVALQVDYPEAPGTYDTVKAALTGVYGDSAPVDLELLGRGVFVLDDDGRLEDQTECWIIEDGTVMIVLEKDNDGDTDAFLIDLTAAYIK